ncbi:MAG: rRNA maturation RNase YbeY [Gemmatimonadota bacterium]
MSSHIIGVNDAQALPFSAALARRIREAVQATLTEAPRGGPGPAVAEISVTLVEPLAMRELNARFHQVDEVTDVLAFGLGESEAGESLLGDIYVCTAVAVAFAEEHDDDPEDEIVRLAIHGTLHLLGHEHPEGADRYDSDMYRLQERLLRSG